MGRLVDIQSGFACAKKNLVPASMGVAHLRPFNVGTDGKVDLSEVYYIPPDFKHNVEDYALEPGHILFNNTNSVELVGKTALVTEPMPATFSNHIYRLALKQKAKRRLEPAWLALALRRLWAMGYFAEQCNRWIGQAGFNATKLKEVAIPLPPLDEQRRIVARIDALFDRIDEAQRLRVAAEVDADRFLDAALSDMFAGSETEDWKQRPFKDVWKEKARYGSFETPHVVETDYPVIRVGNLVDGVLVFDDLRYLSLSEKQLRRCELVDGDVIIARAIGSRAHLGKCAVFRPPSTEKTFVLDSHLIRVRVNRTVDPDYVRYYLSSLPGRDEILRNSRQSAIQFNINVGELSRVRLPLPPLPEQRRIVDYLDGLQAQVAELKRLQAASAVELERLSGAVLTRALKGEL